MGIIGIGRISDHIHFREQERQGTGSGGFTRAAFATHQHTTDAHINRIQDEGAFHGGLPDDGGEGINRRSFHKKIIQHLS